MSWDLGSLYQYTCTPTHSSYLHAEWASCGKLLQGDRRFDGKVKRYKAKQSTLGIFSNVDDEPFNPEYTVVDRVLDMATQAEANGEVSWSGCAVRGGPGLLLHAKLELPLFVRWYRDTLPYFVLPKSAHNN